MQIRGARGAEVDDLRRLIVESMAYWEHGPAYLAAAQELMSLDADDMARDEAFVLEVDGERAGFCRVSVNGTVAEIEEMHLRPGWIGQGYGRDLFEHAAQRAAARGAHVLRWSTERNALGFYRRMGGRVVGTEPSGIAGEEPLILMELSVAAINR
jgi:GNAT superfamily N-acetyltransferase